MQTDQNPSTADIDIEALIAQIDAGQASQDNVVATIGDFLQNNKPIPLKLEAAALKFYIANDATRIDLKRRLIVVEQLLGNDVDDKLLSDVRSDMISGEHATDFQTMLEEFGRTARYADMEPAFKADLDRVRRYTMTTIERLYALWSAVEYVAASRLPGDIVECGVWRGGSMMLAALKLKQCDAADRKLWLFDTFAGLPKPDAEIDIDVLGNRAIDGWNAHTLSDGKTYWAYADEADVRNNMSLTGYPNHFQEFVAGLVEETIPTNGPATISLLRIDTDFYNSYKHILHHFYDRVAPGGVIIFDDYGHFGGAKRAVDEFMSERGIVTPLIRVDYSCRMMIKQGNVVVLPPLGLFDRVLKMLGIKM